MAETYTIPVECTNCFKGGHVEFPKGTPVTQICICPNCGCNTATPCSDRKVRHRPDWDIMPKLPPGPPNWGGWSQPHWCMDRPVDGIQPNFFPPQILCEGKMSNQQ